MLKRVRVLVPLALFCLAACGDDAAPADDDAAGQSGSAAAAGAGAGAVAGSSAGAGAGTGAGASGRSGSSGAADVEEGSPCMGDADCVAGLRCAAIPGLLFNGVPVGVCGNPCMMDADCGDGSVCHSYSDMDRDKHCVEVIEEDYALCGIAETSVCKMGSVCLVFDTPVAGVCATLCQAGAGDADAGMPTGEAGAEGCAAGQSCIGGVFEDAPPEEGICGREVARGADCGIDIGVGDFCGMGDICAPDDLEDEASAVRCYQACSRANPQCDTGACVLASNMIGYCI
jgi:hypothetical protein